MKKLLITVCLSGLLSVPSVVLGAEMGGASLYGSFRAGLSFGSGDAKVQNYGSRWGIKGSHEVSEGLTASYKFEGGLDMTDAEAFGGAGHGHDQEFVKSDLMLTSVAIIESDLMEDDDLTEDDLGKFKNACARGSAFVKNKDDEYEALGDELTVDKITDTTSPAIADISCGNLFDTGADSDAGGRISSISLSGGFGTVTLGQFWSASANHYGFAVDPTNFNGSFGGTTSRPGNQISYSSSAGDVSFQIDMVTGNEEALEFGASAALGPVGVGLGYWSNANDKASFTGVAISAGAGGVGLAVGLGSSDDAAGVSSDTSIISVSGALGDSGVSYGVQVKNTDEVDDDGKNLSQNLVSLVNTLGSGASIHLEHLDPRAGDSTSHIVLKVDF